MSICQLCLKDLELRNSHIIPEFLHKKLYNNKGHLAAINGQGNKGYKPLQQGLREYLFCECCEQHFNEYCEKPFQTQWINANPNSLPDPWSVSEPYWITVDYNSFKLFHLSVLFRASVSSLPNFAEVSLGPHQDRLRQMILNRDPGKFWQYSIFGVAVIHHKTKRIIHSVTMACRTKYKEHTCYSTIYGGVQWSISVSSHRNREFEHCALQKDGCMPFHAVHWNELEVFQIAAIMLRNTR